MTLWKLSLATFGCALVIGAGTGCSAHGSQSGFEDGDGGVGSNGDSGGVFGGGGGNPGSAPTLLYAHTDTTLYTLDPTKLGAPLTTVGTFDCVGAGSGSSSMTDLAVTKDGHLFGVSQGAAYPLTVQNGVVHCEATWTLPNTKFFGLTIAPENTVAANEVLIGADGAGGLYQIDPNSGTPTQVGTLGTDPRSGKPWALSGDIVFMANGGNPIGFATVRTCTSGTNCTTTDTLIEVDVHAIRPGTQSVLKTVRGQVVRGSWCTNASSPSTFGSMFGIVAYEDKVYGFSRQGDIIEIHNTDGTGCLVQAAPSLKFAGAGISTTARVTAPPPK